MIIMIPQQRKPILEKKKRCGCWGYHRSLLWNHHHCYTLLLWLLGKKQTSKNTRGFQFNGDMAAVTNPQRRPQMDSMNGK